MIRLAAVALAAPVLAQTAAPPAAPPAAPQNYAPQPTFIAAAQAFGACVKQTTAAIPATVTPQAGAQQAVTTCAAQRAALDASFEAWVSSPAFPAAGRQIARDRYQEEMAQISTKIADGIIEGRAAAAPAPAASPSPTPGK